MKKTALPLSVVLALVVPSIAMADGLLPPKVEQKPAVQSTAPLPVIEVKMPDGSTQKGFIQDGKFIPILPPPSQAGQMLPPPQAQQPITGQATYSAPPTANLNQHIDSNANINQTSQSNNYNAYRQDHDTVDKVRGYSDVLFRAVNTFAGFRR